jgi:DNA-binding LacI/PurR family transcriptional regulator
MFSIFFKDEVTMKITIEDVAKKAGVSKATVSRILNGNFEHSKMETRNRVLEAVKELDFRPNALARGLKQSKTNVLGVVLSNLHVPFWSDVLKAVEDTCSRMGYSVMICNTNDNTKIEEELIRNLQMRRVDGIIIHPTLRNPDLYHSLVSVNFPIVSLKKNLSNINTVIIDNFLGAKLAVEHLLKLGRKRIAFLTRQPDGVRPREERLDGYKKTLLEHNIQVDESLIHVVQNQGEEVKRVCTMLLRGPNRPDAILCTESLMELDVMEAAKELNLKIPTDVALIGYNENVWLRYMDPPITTINQPSYQMGVLAVNKLLELIERSEKKEPGREAQTVVLKPSIIVRKSCGFSESGIMLTPSTSTSD